MTHLTKNNQGPTCWLKAVSAEVNIYSFGQEILRFEVSEN
jgi:hypothetical protein